MWTNIVSMLASVTIKDRRKSWFYKEKQIAISVYYTKLEQADIKNIFETTSNV